MNDHDDYGETCLSDNVVIDPLLSSDERWLLPEAVEEILPPHSEFLERLRREILDLFLSWGYQYVIPPLIEYLDSLLIGTGDDLDLSTFKLTDQLTGRLLGVRADMTPQVARIDAHLKRNTPTRLCYLDNTLHTLPGGFAKSRIPIQVGAEIYGHGGVDSDIEVLRLMVAMLAKTGLTRLHIDLGHVGIFRGLAHEAHLTRQQESILFDALQRKAKPEIKAYLASLDIAKSHRQMLAALVDLHGGAEVLDTADSVLDEAGVVVQDALEDLHQIAVLAQKKLPNIPLHFDLAELRGYHYQTGVVYAAFVPGYGHEVARGGRYDDIGKAFGRARPATGFSADLKTLMLLSPHCRAVPKAILAPCSDDEALHKMVDSLRTQGERVIYELPGQVVNMKEMRCDRVLRKEGGQWVVVKASKED